VESRNPRVRILKATNTRPQNPILQTVTVAPKKPTVTARMLELEHFLIQHVVDICRK
jgi:hypothetical protein